MKPLTCERRVVSKMYEVVSLSKHPFPFSEALLQDTRRPQHESGQLSSSKASGENLTGLEQLLAIQLCSEVHADNDFQVFQSVRANREALASVTG